MVMAMAAAASCLSPPTRGSYLGGGSLFYPTSYYPPPVPHYHFYSQNNKFSWLRKICCNSFASANDNSINKDRREGNGEQVVKEKEREQIKVLSAIRSKYNDIVILQTHPNNPSRLLLLDSTHNVHSIYNQGEKWTTSYWDEFASLPAIIPKGPVAILGLGGGTAAHLMLDLWPSLELEGWDIDEILIDKAREYMGLSDLEKHTPAGGILHVRIGDALSPSVHVPGGYAGIVVDLFADGKVLPQLTEVETWLKLNDKLMPNGRLMVNCGASDNEDSNTLCPETSSDSAWENNLTIKALCQALPGQLMNWKKMRKEEGENYLALSGPLPNLNSWSAAVPDRLSLAVKQWRPCFPH